MSSASLSLKGAAGLWQPVPVEYKRGRPKFLNCDKVQLCAQGMCLEEMLHVSIPKGFIYYGKTRKRLEVPFDSSLREETGTLAKRLHEYTQKQFMPKAQYEKKCESCSLLDHCMPKQLDHKGESQKYLQRQIHSLQEDSGE